MDKLELLAESQDEGSKWMEKFILNDKATERDFKKARVVTSFLATQVRAHSAIIAKERVRFSMARLITDDKEELKKYMDATAPSSSGSKALESK